MLTVERLKDLLSYDPATGCFAWRQTLGRHIVQGRAAGSVHQSRGKLYLRIKIEGRKYMAHRLAWLFVHGVWPEAEIDHRNCNGLDNAIDNLREATRGENCWNAVRKVTNTSGVKGVYFDDRLGKWRARVMAGRKNFDVGCFATVERAAAARTDVMTALHGAFARAA